MCASVCACVRSRTFTEIVLVQSGVICAATHAQSWVMSHAAACCFFFDLSGPRQLTCVHGLRDAVDGGAGNAQQLQAEAQAGRSAALAEFAGQIVQFLGHVLSDDVCKKINTDETVDSSWGTLATGHPVPRWAVPGFRPAIRPVKFTLSLYFICTHGGDEE